MHATVGDYVVHELEMVEQPLISCQPSQTEAEPVQQRQQFEEIKVEPQEIKEEFDPLANLPDEEFTYEAGTVTDARMLRKEFTRNYSYCKATNIGKFITRILFGRMQHFEAFLPETKDKSAEVQWLRNFASELERRKNKTRNDLLQLFGEAETDRRNRWGSRRRHFMHFLLTEDSTRLKLVLGNNYIKHSQKQHYLYSLKVYEWRLNDARLVGNFN